jgi:hypothetical protein
LPKLPFRIAPTFTATKRVLGLKGPWVTPKCFVLTMRGEGAKLEAGSGEGVRTPDTTGTAPSTARLSSRDSTR